MEGIDSVAYYLQIQIILQTGQYGSGLVAPTFAVKDKVPWQEAADLCSLGFNRQATLFYRNRPVTLEKNLMHHRYILQQNGWSLYDHIWTGYISIGDQPWKRSRAEGSCSTLSSDFDGYFPDILFSSPKCVLMNVTGETADDLFIYRPCDEHHSFMCKPYGDTYSGIVEVTYYLDFYIDINKFDNDVKANELSGINMTECETRLKGSSLTFAAIYNLDTSMCLLYISKVLKYPVHIELLHRKSSTAFVKTEGLNVTILENLKVQVIDSLYNECFGPQYVNSTPYTTGENLNIDLQTTRHDDKTTLLQNIAELSPEYSERDLKITNDYETPIITASNEPDHSTAEHLQASNEPDDSTSEPFQASNEPDHSTLKLFQTSNEPDHSTSELFQASYEPDHSTSELFQASYEPDHSTLEMTSLPDCTDQCRTYCFQEQYLQWEDSYHSDNVKLDKHQLSSYKRRLYSASDERLSANMIGVSGAIVLIMAALFVIIPDLVNGINKLRGQRQDFEVE